MKKFLITLLCTAVAFSMCFAAAVTAYASDTGSEEDVSLEEFLKLLNELNEGDSGSESSEAEPEMSDYTLDKVTFSLPAEWDMMEEDENIIFFSPVFTDMATALYEEDPEGEVDILDESDMMEFVSALGGEGADVTDYYITVCGYPGVWLSSSFTDQGLPTQVYSAVVQLDGAVFVLTLTSLDTNAADLFARMVQSISIDGASGETELYPAYVEPHLIVPDSGPGEVEVSDPQEADAEGPEEIDASGQERIVLLDDEMCTVTLSDLKLEDEYYAMTGSITLENKSEMDLYCTMDKVSINDYMCNPFWGMSVPAGQHDTQDFFYYKSDFDINNIKTVRDMEFTLIVRDDTDWFGDIFAEKPIILYPNGPDVPEQEPVQIGPDATILLDTEDYLMVLKGCSEDSFYFSADLYIENNSDQELDFSVTGTTAVNGVEMNPYFSRTLEPGKKINAQAHWLLGDLTENGIDKVEDLKLDVAVSDSEDWFADPIDTALVDIKVG